MAKAIALVKKLRLYPLAKSAKPPEQRFIDMAGKLFDGIVRSDKSFYESLARMVNEEPVQPRDLAAVGQLRALGIRKGEEFKPSAATQAALSPAVQEAQAGFIQALAGGEPWWPGSHWGLPESLGPKTAFTFQTADRLDVDARGLIFFLAYAPPAKLGAATFYLVGVQDAEGNPLQGLNTYRLRIRTNVPAQQFWAVTVYDLESAGFIRESPRVGVDSYDQRMRKNADGSVDISFGPRPPAGQESNWVDTASGKDWFALFRFYGPEKPLFEKTWKLLDIEKTK